MSLREAGLKPSAGRPPFQDYGTLGAVAARRKINVVRKKIKSGEMEEKNGKKQVREERKIAENK